MFLLCVGITDRFVPGLALHNRMERIKGVRDEIMENDGNEVKEELEQVSEDKR